MKKKLAGLSVEELHDLKCLIGGWLVLLALWAILALDLGLEWHVVFGVLAVFASLFKPIWTKSLPQGIWILLRLLILGVFLADFILSMPHVIPSLVRMVILLLIYRTLVKRQKREDLQLLLLCFFCLVLSGTLTMSLLFGFQILIFTPLALSFLFVVCLLDHAQGDPELRKQSSWMQLCRRLLQAVDFRIIGLCVGLYLFTVAVSSLLFFVIPRVSLDQAIPFLQMETKPYSGFSDEVRLGSVSEITEDSRVAFRIDVPSIKEMGSSPYWRMLVLDEYKNGGFRMSSGLKAKLSEDIQSHELYGLERKKNEVGNDLWTFYLEGGISRYFPVPGLFRRMRLQGLQKLSVMQEIHVFSTDIVKQNVFFYQIEGLTWSQSLPASRREVEFFERAHLFGMKEKGEYPYTQLSLNLSREEMAWLDRLNRQLRFRSAAPGASQYSQLVINHLWENFQYSLNPSSVEAEGDPVIGWLKEGDRGHCELFAASFVLLARQAGYPARMVVGFSGGTWNPVESYFIVRNKDAHAWVEIYDAETRQWLRVDPTPGNVASVPEVFASASLQFESGWSAWLDSLRIQWYRRVVNFDEQDQMALAMGLKHNFNEAREELLSRFKSLVEDMKALWKQPFEKIPLIYLLLVIPVGVALVLFFQFRFVWMHCLMRMWKHPQALDPIRREAGRYLRRLKSRQCQAHSKCLPRGISEIYMQLEAVRFGPFVREVEAQLIFKQARHILRRVR